MTEPIKRTHHHFTNDNEDYTLYSIHCGSCGLLLYEFVHKQVFVGYTPPFDALSARYLRFDTDNPDLRTPSGYAQAQSWCSAKLKVRCHDLNDQIRVHTLDPCKDGENLNQVVRSKGMTTAQFKEWMKANDRA